MQLKQVSIDKRSNIRVVHHRFGDIEYFIEGEFFIFEAKRAPRLSYFRRKNEHEPRNTWSTVASRKPLYTHERGADVCSGFIPPDARKTSEKTVSFLLLGIPKLFSLFDNRASNANEFFSHRARAF